MTRALMLFGHPESNSFNGRLAQAYADGFARGGGVLTRLDLAALSFDPQLRAGYRAEQPLEPDLVRLREAIVAADHLVWVFPMWWAAPPAVVRAVVERVFVPNWAFRYEPGRALPLGLLRGRSARVVMTMDSPWWWYSLVLQRPVHRSFGGATLRFCGLRPVEFTTVHGVREMGEGVRARWCERLGEIGHRDAATRAGVALPAAS